MKNINRQIPVLFLFSFFMVAKDVKGNLLKENHFYKICCTSPDSAGSISGKTSLCFGDTATYSVPAIALATGYDWTLPSGASIISGANTRSIKVVFNGSGGYIKVFGTNTCLPGKSSSILVKVNPLPKLSVISRQKYCCDHKNIALDSGIFGTPVGGTWICRQNSTYINSNTFLTSLACDSKKPTAYSLIYTFKDASTTCINKDSTLFVINPLPHIKLKDGYYCQNKMEAPLKPHILAPILLNSLAASSWKLLKSLPKKGGGQNTINSLVYDADPTLNFDYRLKVDTGTIDLGSNARDSLILEFTIQDGEGCINKDTMTIHILKVPVITFNAFPDLCIKQGKVNLNTLSNMKPDNGCWKVTDTAGFCNSSQLKPGLTGCDSLNTLLLNPVTGPCLYRLSYIHSVGCPVQINTTLRINPLPNVKISISPGGDKGKFCETDWDVILIGSPAGGVWSGSVSGIITGSKFMPSAVTAFERDKWITLTYVYINPITKCDTAKSLQVFVQSRPKVDIITADIDTCWRKVMDFKLTANYSFTNKITWYHSFNPLKASFDNKQQISSGNPVRYSITPVKDSLNYAFITLISDPEGVCPFSMDSLKIKINPVPCKDSIVGIIKILPDQPFDFSLFPNPNKGKFGVEINKHGAYSFKLYSIGGKLVLEKKIEGLQLETINQKLPKGNYNIIIEDSDGNKIQKRVMVE